MSPHGPARLDAADAGGKTMCKLSLPTRARAWPSCSSTNLAGSSACRWLRVVVFGRTEIYGKRQMTIPCLTCRRPDRPTRARVPQSEGKIGSAEIASYVAGAGADKRWPRSCLPLPRYLGLGTYGGLLRDTRPETFEDKDIARKRLPLTSCSGSSSPCDAKARPQRRPRIAHLVTPPRGELASSISSSSACRSGLLAQSGRSGRWR